MPDALLTRRGLTLVPVDGLAEVEIETFPLGRYVRCSLKGARSDRNLRHYFACLTAFSKATGIGTKDMLHDMLKLQCGLARPIQTLAGEIVLVPDSVAFDRLDEADFKPFKARAFETLRINFGVDPTELSNEGAALLGGAQ